jgi:hypothetical protein
VSGQAVAWVDLTVPNAAEARDFYAGVAGWSVSEVEMGGYADFTLHGEGGEAVAGVCHARGENADLPPVWIVYFCVEEIEQAAGRCVELGGEVLRGPSPPNDSGRTCFVRDPAGAVVAFFEPGTVSAPGT